MNTPQKVLGHLMSRGVLGSMLVGTAIGKVVEKAVILAWPDSTVARMFGWMVAAAVFVTMYLYWANLAEYADAATDAADDVTDTIDDVTDGTDDSE